MPLVASHPSLQDALAAYLVRSESTKAQAASEFGLDPMTLARFLKTGRAIEVNRQKLEEGLARVGAWNIPKEASDKRSKDLISNDKVIAALEFLLDAARKHDERASGVGR